MFDSIIYQRATANIATMEAKLKLSIVKVHVRGRCANTLCVLKIQTTGVYRQGSKDAR